MSDTEETLREEQKAPAAAPTERAEAGESSRQAGQERNAADAQTAEARVQADAPAQDAPAGEKREEGGGRAAGAREKLDDALAEVREKVAPALDHVKEAAGDVIDRVKDGMHQALHGEKRPPDVRNAFFDELEEQVAEDRKAIDAQAAEMQKKIEEMLGKKND